MKRGLSWIFNGLTALSLLLLLATVALWIRSYWIADLIRLDVVTHRTPVKPPPHVDPVYFYFPHEFQDGFSLRAESAAGINFFVFKENSGSGMSTRVVHSSNADVNERRVVWEGVFARSDVPDLRLRLPGLRVGISRPWKFWGVFIKDWLVAVLASVLPCLWRVRRILRKRRLLSIGGRLCRHCGYDLRATPNRCPECGTPMPARGMQ